MMDVSHVLDIPVIFREYAVEDVPDRPRVYSRRCNIQRSTIGGMNIAMKTKKELQISRKFRVGPLSESNQCSYSWK